MPWQLGERGVVILRAGGRPTGPEIPAEFHFVHALDDEDAIVAVDSSSYPVGSACRLEDQRGTVGLFSFVTVPIDSLISQGGWDGDAPIATSVVPTAHSLRQAWRQHRAEASTSAFTADEGDQLEQKLQRLLAPLTRAAERMQDDIRALQANQAHLQRASQAVSATPACAASASRAPVAPLSKEERSLRKLWGQNFEEPDGNFEDVPIYPLRL